MRRIFEFRQIEVEPLSWARTGSAYAESCHTKARSLGGALYGVWAGQIGLDRDQGIVMTAWTDLATAKRAGPSSTKADGLRTDSPVYLEATVRPKADQKPTAPGFYAHRWFHLLDSDWPEFLALSNEAWPFLENAVDATVLGFWRALDNVQAGHCEVLLLTHYATLNDWERSRWWGRPAPAAKAAMQRFRRRTELVLNSRVVISTLPSQHATL